MEARVFLRGLWVLVLFASVFLAASARATNFAILLGGVDASKECTEISIDELSIDIREMTTGTDVDYRTVAQGWRVYAPGTPHFGSAKLTLAPGVDGELNTWFQEAAKGKNIRKNITVTLYKSDKTPARTYNLFDCFPTQWSSVNYDSTGAVVDPATLTVSIGGMSFSSEASRQSGLVKGCWISLDSDPAPMRVDSWGGGEPALLLTPLFANSKFHTTSPGHKSVGEITLRGAMTDGRKAMMEWINNVLTGKKWKQMLTVTELLSVDGGVKDGKQYMYFDGFPVSYVFPKMSVAQAPGSGEEIITIKPIRLEMK